jgi:MoaA/NifB/PqqE/SkfB family radical SAM enzyme
MNFKNLFAFSGKYHPLDKSIVKEFNKIRSREKRKYLCHAPFKSLTFFHTGNVLACWYNKFFSLGHYPENSIHDIWFSERAEKLRGFIKHKDLSYGCVDCKRQFLSRNYYSTGAWRYDFLPDVESKYPVSMDFQISNQCNLQCIMCNGEYSAKVRSKRENQDQFKNPYDDNFLEQIKPFLPYLKEASFSGGEPFFAKEFFKLWDIIIETNPNINASVTTNGNIYNEKIQKYLDALPFNINVSLDAITEETYSKIRVSGSFSAVMKNIDIFEKYTRSRGTTFAVKTCPMRQNWREIPELARFLNDRNISFLYNIVFYPPYCSLWNMDSARLAEVASFLKKHSLKENTEIQKQNAVRYSDLIRHVDDWYKAALQRESLKLDLKSVDELTEMFLGNAKKYLDTVVDNLHDESPLTYEKVRQTILQLIKDSPSEKVAFDGLLFYVSAPVDRLLAEMEIREYEKNLDRFLQISLMENNENLDH